MRRFFSLVIVACMVVALAVVAGVGASNPTRGADIYGVGGGETLFGFGNFGFSAHHGPNGDFGQVYFDQVSPFVPVKLVADVDCVNVFGMPGMGGALIGSVVTKISPTPNALGLEVGDRVLWLANDGGDPSAAPVDFFDGAITDLDCNAARPSVPAPNVTKGNVVVNDG